MQGFLPYGRQCISDADIAAVALVLRSDWLTQGPLVEDFEKGICESTGAVHAVSCNSGTAALHLALMAAGLQNGQAAIVPAITFLATANAVRMTGAEVVFSDVDPQTGRMTAETLEAAFAQARCSKQDVRAVLPVHLGGEASSMPGIASVSAAHNAIVIEDACHAFGGAYSRPNGTQAKVGACADSAMACFSFHPVKPVTTAEGGAVTTNDVALADHMRRLRSHGMTRERERLQNGAEAFDANGDVNPWYYEMPEIGWNYRISDIHCALGLSQLGRLDEFRNHREALAWRYRELIAPLATAVEPVPPSPGVTSGHHLFVVLIDFQKIGTTRARVMKELRDREVGTQVHYVPVPWQPYYTARYGTREYLGAAAYYRRCLSLPLFPAMGEDDVDRVVLQLTEVLGLA